VSARAKGTLVPVYDVRLVRSRRPLRLADSEAPGPEAASRIFHALVGESDREQLACLFVDTHKRIVGAHVANIGGQARIDGVDPRCILRAAILARACALLVGHNHPSGNVTPSPEDIAATKRLYEACALLGVPLLDHLIVTPDEDHWLSMHSRGFFSFAEGGAR
jgi:DNA repair protein RadC